MPSGTKFIVEISTDNAAFDDGNRNREIARLLRKVADNLENENDNGTLRDINGNAVGGFGDIQSRYLPEIQW